MAIQNDPAVHSGMLERVPAGGLGLVQRFLQGAAHLWFLDAGGLGVWPKMPSARLFSTERLVRYE